MEQDLQNQLYNKKVYSCFFKLLFFSAPHGHLNNSSCCFIVITEKQTNTCEYCRSEGNNFVANWMRLDLRHDRI